MQKGLLIAGAMLGLSLGFGAGVLVGMDQVLPPTEQQMAQVLSGDKDVRLIGFLCGDHALTAVARYEDEFPETGCKEIRRLRDGRSS